MSAVRDLDLSEAIAIVGMAGRFPGRRVRRATLGEPEGRQGIDLRPQRRGAARLGDRRARFSPILSTSRRAACWRTSTSSTHPSSGSRREEAELTDPQHRLFLETCYRALEDAGCNPETFDGGIGVFGGMSMNTYLLAARGRDAAFLEGADRVLPDRRISLRARQRLQLPGDAGLLQAGPEGAEHGRADRVLDLAGRGLPRVPGAPAARLRRRAGGRRLDHLSAEEGLPLPGRRDGVSATAGAGPSTPPPPGPCSARGSAWWS